MIAGQYSAVDSITDSSTPCLFSHADNRCRLFGIDGKRHRSGLTSAYPHPSPPPSIPMTHKLTRVSDASNMPARSFKAQDKAPAQNAIGFKMVTRIWTLLEGSGRIPTTWLNTILRAASGVK